MEGKDVRLMPVTGLACMRAVGAEGGAVETVRSLAGLHFFGEVRDTLQHARGLINIIANVFKVR